MPESLANLLIQIPLVGIFVWFILERDKRSDAQQSTRESQWRDFIKEQREQNNAAIAHLAEKIESISHEVSRLNSVLSAHDAASKERLTPRGRS
jgi:hypothetical protein